MHRRIALKNIAIITGSTFILPYGCDFETGIVYSNFTSLKKSTLTLLPLLVSLFYPVI